MKQIYILWILLICSTVNASVLSLDNEGDYIVKSTKVNLQDLVQDYARLKSLNLQLDSKLDKNVHLWGPLSVKKNNIDLFVTSLLAKHGKTILIDEALKQLNVISSRDVRYSAVKVYKNIEDVPHNYHYAQLILKLKHITTDRIARNMRPFLSRYGRVVDNNLSNQVTLSDTGVNIKMLYGLIKRLDTKEFNVRALEVKRINDRYGKLETVKVKSFFEIFKDQHTLFLIVFSFLGLIIGFGFRGYMMKRIEGGW